MHAECPLLLRRYIAVRGEDSAKAVNKKNNPLLFAT
jgi:hypothetical protein